MNSKATTERETALRNIAVGDIFHATTPNNASLICLAEKITATTIHSRTMTSRYELEFDRRTGIAELDVEIERVRCTVDSVAPLPDQIREALLQLERMEAEAIKGRERRNLKKAEWQALAFAARYFPANLLPPPGEAWEALGIDFSRAPKGDPDDFESLTLVEAQKLVLINYLIPRNHWQELGPSPPSAAARSG